MLVTMVWNGRQPSEPEASFGSRSMVPDDPVEAFSQSLDEVSPACHRAAAAACPILLASEKARLCGSGCWTLTGGAMEPVVREDSPLPIPGTESEQPANRSGIESAAANRLLGRASRPV